MSWAHQPSQSDFRLILTRVSDLKTGNYIGALYIGVGDQFGVGASSDGTSLEAQDGAIVTVKSSGWGRSMSALGQKQTCAPQKVMSASPSKADVRAALAYVCFGPKADIRVG